VRVKRTWAIGALILVLLGAGVWRVRERRSGDAPGVAQSPPPRPPEIVAAVATLPAETEEERKQRLKRFGDVPREKVALIAPILRDYGEQEVALRLQQRGPDGLGRAQWRALQWLWDERLADLRKVLTPEEADDCDMMLRPTGKNFVDSLRDLPVSAEERRALYRVVRDFDREFGGNGAFNPMETIARERARVAMYDQLRAGLGETRFPKFLAVDDLSYRRLEQVAAAGGHPTHVADELWRLKNESRIRRLEVFVHGGGGTASRLVVAIDREIALRAAALVGEAAVRENPTAFEWLGYRL